MLSDSACHAAGGEKIVFTRNLDGDREIFVMNSDTTQQQQLTSNGNNDDWARWSPNGDKIAFHSDRSGSLQIWVMNPDGTDPAQVTSGSSQNFHPTWSPDGQKIAYVSDQTGSYRIWVIDADGTNPTQLTFDEGIHFSPHWSPTGDRIAYENRSNPPISTIWTINADGTHPQNLTAGVGSQDEQPAWSPDGQKIAFMRNLTIFRMNADGSSATQLASGSPIGYHHPTWHPDGTRLLFWSFDSLRTVNADGSGSQILASGGPDSYLYAEWSPEPGDNTPPVTVLNEICVGLNVQITLTATDLESGVAETYYQYNNGPLQVYSGPLVVPSSGSHLLQYWSADLAGNVEAYTEWVSAFTDFERWQFLNGNNNKYVAYGTLKEFTTGDPLVESGPDLLLVASNLGTPAHFGGRQRLGVNSNLPGELFDAIDPGEELSLGVGSDASVAGRYWRYVRLKLDGNATSIVTFYLDDEPVETQVIENLGITEHLVGCGGVAFNRLVLGSSSGRYGLKGFTDAARFYFADSP